MNASIARLFGLVLVLVALLVGFTSRWTVFEAEALRDNDNNRRELLAEQLIKRGVIRSADGKVLARSPALPQKRFGRRYPTGALFAHAVGCTSLDRGRAGLENYYNDALTGRATNAIDAVSRLLGPAKVGDDLRTTLDLFNLFDVEASDIDYYFTSRLPGEPLAGVDDLHFHPAVPRTLRLAATITF